MAMVQFLSLDALLTAQDTYAVVRKTCLDTEKIQSAAEQATFRCILGADAEHVMFPVTYVQMQAGEKFILKHSYDEVMKAILAAREERPAVLSFMAAHALTPVVYTKHTMTVLWKDVLGIGEGKDIVVTHDKGTMAGVEEKSCVIILRGQDAPIIAVHPASELLPTFYKVNKP